MSGTRFLQNLKFDNLVLRQLPVDSSKIPGSRVVRSACFSLVDPTPVDNPHLVCASSPALQLLGLNKELIEDKINQEEVQQELAEYFSGNTILDGSETAAHCYCGHQFGYFSGQLGDGAAMYLGEVINQKSERWEIQLKGAGKTPFSRSADGRKVLRSSIREFLCSEAMHHLGIPTTRAGTVITSDSFVIRDMFYDGHAKKENCAVVLRIAPTFLRFGSFEIFKPMDPISGRGGPSPNKTDILIKMLDYVLENFYSHIHSNTEWSTEDKYLKMYEEICQKTAQLVSKWQCVGFCHGVLNTDNMSILGITIDYGPFGFLDRYNPDFICNSSDDNGRYSYKKQPDICHWNLKMLAHALKNALPLEKSLPVLESTYYPAFNSAYLSQMRQKLGLFEKDDKDVQLVEDFLSMMKDVNADYTNGFRSLCGMTSPMSKNFNENMEKTTESFLASCASFESTKSFVKPSLSDEQIEHLREARSSNPMYMLYAGQIKSLLDEEMSKRDKYQELSAMDEDGFKQHITEKWKTWLDRYVERLNLDDRKHDDHDMHDIQRAKMMKSNNPKYILRNYIAQRAIDEAENGNFQEVQNVLKRLEHPYDDDDVQTDTSCSAQASSIPSAFKNLAYCSLPPADMLGLKVS